MKAFERMASQAWFTIFLKRSKQKCYHVTLPNTSPHLNLFIYLRINLENAS